MFKKWFALILAMLLLIGCNGCGSRDEKAIPSYQATDMGKASGLELVRGIRVDSKDQLVVYTVTEKGEQRYAILGKDGKELRSIRGDFKGDGNFFTLDEKDNLYVLAQSYTMDQTTQKVKEIARQLVIFDASGARVKTVDLGKVVSEDGYNNLTGFEVDSSGNIYLLNQFKPVEVFDPEGKNLGTVGSQGYSCMSLGPEDSLILGSDGQGSGSNKTTLEKWTVPKGESVWKKDPGFNDIPRVIRYHPKDRTIDTLTDRGIKKYSADGSDLGYVLDAKQVGLSGFQSYITGLDRDSAGNYYFTVTEGTGSGGSDQFRTAFYKYSPLGEAAAVKEKGEKILTLNTMETNRFLESAISEFEKANPGIRIKVKGCPSITSMEDLNKYITTLNTELMSDKGPDLVEASYLPYYKYIAKGIFADLGDLMAKDGEFDLKSYNTSLFDSFQYNGKQYVMPVSVFIEAVAANKTLLDEANIRIDDSEWTWKDFLEICKKVTKDTNGDGTPEQFALPYLPPERLFSLMFRNSASLFIDREKKTARLDSPEFIDLLKLAKDYGTGGVACTNQKAVNMSNELFDLYDRNGIVFVPATIYAYGTMGLYGADTVFLQPPSVNGTYKPQYSTWLSLAINNRSKYRDEAWKFVKFMISKEMQSQWALNGFVVNREAISERRKMEIDNTKSGTGKAFNGKTIKPMTDAIMDQADRLVSIPGFMPDYDTSVTNAVSEETKEFFAGRKTAEEAAKSMQNKISTYLNE